MHPEAEVHLVASTQHGLVTIDQACGRGMPARTVHRRVEQGLWVPAHPGVYRIRAVPETWRSRAKAAQLAGPEGSLVTGQMAAYLYDLLEHRPRGAIDVLVPGDTNRSAGGVEFWGTDLLEPRDAASRYGIATTGIDRTLLELSRLGIRGFRQHRRRDEVRTSDRLVETAVVRACLRQLTTRESILEAANGRFKGLPGAPRLRWTASAIDPLLLAVRSHLEYGFLRYWLSRDYPRPEVDHEITDAHGRVRYLDLAFTDVRRFAEVDSHEHHSNGWQRRADLTRDRSITETGWEGIHLRGEDLATPSRGAARLLRFLRSAPIVATPRQHPYK